MKMRINPAYFRLMRLDQPTGALLLWWPTAWALCLATSGVPNRRLLTVFSLGAIIMRSAGCVINDYVDCSFDGLVERTRKRPLPQGEVSRRACFLLLAILISAAFALVLTLNVMSAMWAVIALPLVCGYPFAKQIISAPQTILGLTFSCSIPMAFAAVQNALPTTCWLLFVATALWVISYDTQYAMADREDDLKIGLKSTAILLGALAPICVTALQTIMLFLLGAIAWINDLAWPFYIALLCVAILFFYQYQMVKNKAAANYLKAFHSNNYVGVLVLTGLILALVK